MTGKTRVLLDRPTRRAAILRAAAAAFAERGFADTSMDDVAAAAGITRLIVYRHFDSKEALYAAVLQHVRDRLAEEGRAERGRGESAAVRALLTVGREDAAGVTLLLRARGARTALRVRTPTSSAKQVIAYAEQLMRARSRAGAGAGPMGGRDARVVRVRRVVALDRRRRSRA